MDRDNDVHHVRNRIATIVGSVHARELVAAYFKAGSAFAGAMFDGLESNGYLSDNPAHCFTAEDIAAASLLYVRFGPAAVRALLGSTDIGLALEAIPSHIPLWEMDHETQELASHLWSLVIATPGLGATRTSKLLSRKRPHLIPILDSVIVHALGLNTDAWRLLAPALRDEGLRQTINALRPSEVSERISTLKRPRFDAASF